MPTLRPLAPPHHARVRPEVSDYSSTTTAQDRYFSQSRQRYQEEKNSGRDDHHQQQIVAVDQTHPGTNAWTQSQSALALASLHGRLDERNERLLLAVKELDKKAKQLHAEQAKIKELAAETEELSGKLLFAQGEANFSREVVYDVFAAAGGLNSAVRGQAAGLAVADQSASATNKGEVGDAPSGKKKKFPPLDSTLSPEGIEKMGKWYEHIKISMLSSDIATENAEFKARVLALVSVSINAAVGTSIFASSGSGGGEEGCQEGNGVVLIIAGIMSFMAALFSAIRQTLDYEGRAAKWNTARLGYAKLRKEFEDLYFVRKVPYREECQDKDGDGEDDDGRINRANEEWRSFMQTWYSKTGQEILAKRASLKKAVAQKGLLGKAYFYCVSNLCGMNVFLARDNDATAG